MNLKFVISATDTGVGKTIFSAALTHALGAYFWKPIQAGLGEDTDSEVVMKLGIPRERIIPEAYSLNTPASPHLAAKLDKIKIQTQKLIPPATKSPLVIEGAGGLLVPLTEDSLLIDIFAQWQIPLILCARTTLGTINHTLLALEALRKRSIFVYGLVFIGPEQHDTQDIIAKLGQVNILGRLPFLSPLTSETLRSAFQQYFPIQLFHSAIQ